MARPADESKRRTIRFDFRVNAAERATIDKARQAEAPSKPMTAYIRYAALTHAESVDTSILELRAERWYYYHKDKYGREVCYALDGVQAKEQLDEVMTFEPSNYQICPAMYNSEEITPHKADRLGMHALAALLRAEAAEQDK